MSATSDRGLRIGMVGTYPPTRCGIATFTASVVAALESSPRGYRCGVVASVDEAGAAAASPGVVAELVTGSRASLAAAAKALTSFDVAVVQHEFGIYGGEDGREVLDLLREAAGVPTIVVLHTVPRGPTREQRAIIEQLGSLADRLVVPSRAARVRLLEQYCVDARAVRMIPHGACRRAATEFGRNGRAPVVLTWGLLGPGKGIEWGIAAMALLRDLDPPPRYVVAGETHPKVLERSGDRYRQALEALAETLGVTDLIEFQNEYGDTDAVLTRVREADVVLLPYDSREQVVSGVLVEAIASGKPVVATQFPHAEELLAQGAGLLVPHRDAGAIATAVRRLLTEDGLVARAAAAARRQSRELSWRNVGRRYGELAEELNAGPAYRPTPRRFPAPPFKHLLRLSDDVGVLEHAYGSTPRRAGGYCTDDVARALLVVMREPEPTFALERLADTCLGFLERAQLPDGRFRNRLSGHGAWLDAGDSDDATGRALWAAAVTATTAEGRNRRRSLALFSRGAGFRSPWPRANAFAILGAAEVVTASPNGPVVDAAVRLLSRAAAGLGRPRSDPAWPWPEARLAYANAVLAEARIAAGMALGDSRFVDEGLELLAWLAEVEQCDAHFSFAPVGGWAPGEPRPGFDQQPIEAVAMTDACARAFLATGAREWAERALRAAAWFLGVNDGGRSLFDPTTGGCRDGLCPDGVNRNEGAESTLALIAALQQARRLQAAARREQTRASFSTIAAPTQESAAPYVR